MGSGPLRPEDSLLLLAARAELSSEQQGRLRSLAAGVDWPSLASSAARHRLQPLLLHHLASVAADLCPGPWLEALRDSVRAALAVNMGLLAELRALVSELDVRGIETVVLKGPLLAKLFGGLDRRPFTDVDLLVPRERALEAWRVVEARGYAPTPAIASRWHARWIGCSNEQLFAIPDRELLVDLHWQLYIAGYHFDQPQAELRQRLAATSLGGLAVRTLGPSDTLIFLLVHGAKHEWEALGWLADVAELVRSTRIDWELVARWASGPGRGRLVHLGLQLAARLLEAPAPPWVLALGSADPSIEPLVARVAAALFRPSPPVPSAWQGLVGSVWYHCLSSRSDRLRHVYDWLVMPRPGDLAALPLPRWAWPAYFAIRPVRLLLRQIRGM
jgi:hypothetical protein